MFNGTVNIPGSNPILSHTSQGDINVVYQNSGSQGFKSLTEYVTAEALHNSGEVSDAPKCHPGTRVAILDSVFQWALAPVYLIRIQWIYGPAGAGKSAILRTLAEMLEQHGLLLASFFFFRAAAGRNNADHFIPTLAYQIARSIPSTRRHIEQAIETDPLLFSQTLEAQAQALIILPLIQAHKEGDIDKQYPRIIVIDGLDECQGEEKQRMLLRILNNLLLKLPVPFAILIASRPEPHIRVTFDLDMTTTSARLSLDKSYEPDEDIRKFYNDKFDQIRNHHPLRSHLPKPWPTPSAITTLVNKASGQFIFPATIIKFVEPHRYNPSRRLDMVMGSISPGKLKPFEPLDNLYSTIFASIDPDDLDAVLTVLRVVLVPYSMMDVGWAPHLASLTGYDTTEIRRLLFDLESLLRIEPSEDDMFIRFHHASLVDFLFDQHRAGRFFVSPPMVYEQLARRCIEILLFSEDDLIFLNYEFRHILHNAEPTEDLIKTLKDCNVARLCQMLKGKKCLLRSLNMLLYEVLPAISSSALSGADCIHTQLLATLRQVIASKVDYCFNTDLAPLLVYLIDMGSPKPRAFPSTRIYHICSTQIYPISGENCPFEIENQDQQYGFCLTLGSNPCGGITPGQTWKAFHTLVVNIVGDRAGDSHADFAIHTLNWISKFPIIPVLADEMSMHDDLWHVTEFFLPTLLKKSSPRSDVQQALRSNPFHPIMLGKIPAYAAATQEYFLRTNAVSSQADLHLNASSAAKEMHTYLDVNTGPSQMDISPDDVSGDSPRPQQQLGTSTDTMPSQNDPVIVSNDKMSSSTSTKKNQEMQGSRRRKIKHFFQWR